MSGFHGTLRIGSRRSWPVSFPENAAEGPAVSLPGYMKPSSPLGALAKR